MKTLTIPFLFSFVILLQSCGPRGDKNPQMTPRPIQQVFKDYYEEYLRHYPLAATSNGDYRYNDLLRIDISESWRDSLRQFYRRYQDSLSLYNRESLSDNDRTSYDILKWDLQTAYDGLQFQDHLMPINQFWSLTLTFPQLGSGSGNQPFRNIKDYEDFLVRIHTFSEWCDTAIANMKKGMAAGVTYPKILMERVLPQLSAMVVEDPVKSVFYEPLAKLTERTGDTDRQRLKDLYAAAIHDHIVPSYRKLYEFMKNEYLPSCRETAGISNIPGGKEYYNYLIRQWTTTNMTADQVFELGQQEVKRLRAEMEKIKEETGFKGDLKAFFKYLNTDKRFFPFHNPKEVIDSFEHIHTTMMPQLSKLFHNTPKTKFEIRQTEKFREASASAEYNQGTPDGLRPGVFFVPVPDARKFNTFGMEDLFLHEAIPGHHYQISLQQENDSLPEFRRFSWYGAYGEGWALYTESLGKELGLYKDPYQYFGSLSEEMHRAIRLVVDVGMHVKGWTREQAIQFSLDNEGAGEESLVSEIERYMAIPGQALGYKIGQLKIRELRAKAEKELGASFDAAAFHDAVLKHGCLPLQVLEEKINAWIEATRTKNPATAS